MKFFRQELINREDNYNKIFNANPIVGTMNPMMNKKNSGVIQNGGQGQMQIGQGQMQMGAGMGQGGLRVADPNQKRFPESNKNIMRQGTNPNAMGSMNDMPMINSQNNIMKSRMK